MALGSTSKHYLLFFERLSREISEACSLAAAWVLACLFRKRLSSFTVELFVRKAPGEVWAQCLPSSSARSYHFPMLKFRRHSRGVWSPNHTVCSWSKITSRRSRCSRG